MNEGNDFSTQVGTKLLHEDDHARVWCLDLEPGESTEWHRHTSDYVFVVTQTGTVRCDYADGATEVQEGDPVGSSQYRRRDVPHRLVNVGDRPYRNIVIELKQQGND